tara:strand:- start:4300 stop:5202 length:903 start_codon:yes stop_codon:yes gene_type:complete
MADQSTLYSRWLKGDLSDEERKSIRENGEEDQLKNIINAVDLWESNEINLDDAYQNFTDHKANRKKVKKIIPQRAWLAAASILLVVSSIYLFYSASYTKYTVLNGMNESITLSDGSSVILNDGSFLKHRSGLLSKQRVVHLKGEGLFEVKKGEKFKVYSTVGDVEVLGTQFNVRTWGDKLTVECYEGQVRVSNKKDFVILEKGESVIMTEGKAPEKQIIINILPDWMNNFSQFQDEPLSDVFAELERQYNFTITQMDINKKFTGQVTHENLTGAMESICIPLGLEFNIDQEQKSIVVRNR